MKTGFAIFIVLLFMAVSPCVSQNNVIELPKTKQVTFEAWRFNLEVPKNAQRNVIAVKDDVELSELYVYGEYIYFIKIIKTPADSITSTAIEQDLQAEYNYSVRLGDAKRWEMDTRQKNLFKGISHYVRPAEDMPDEAAVLEKVLKGRTGYVCAAIGPLGDESSSMLRVGVISFKGRDAEVDKLAKFMVFGVEIKPDNAAAAKTPVPAKLPNIRPAKTVQPKVRVLKKGDIEITGKVESIAEDKKSLVVLAEQIRMPDASPIKLSPARRKTVTVKSGVDALSVGSSVVVIGKNAGVGAPIEADVLEQIASNAPGNNSEK